MTTDNTQVELEEILGLWANSVQDHPDMSMPILKLSDTKQAILQWVSETVVGQDEPGVTNIMIATEHERQREVLRKEAER